MSAKTALKRSILAIGDVPGVARLAGSPLGHRIIDRIPGGGVLFTIGWQRRHPFDRRLGTDTSGFVAADELAITGASRAHALAYAGTQPHAIREGIRAVPRLEDLTFVDLGCGKGRAVIVAGEFPFRAVLGVELDQNLVDVARRNLDLVAPRFPDRPPTGVVQGDATTVELPEGDLLVFLGNPFGAEVMAAVAGSLGRAVQAGRKVFVLYVNAVSGHCFDESPLFHRMYVREVPYAPEERGFGPGEADVVMLWQGSEGRPDVPAEAAAARLVVSGGHATLA